MRFFNNFEKFKNCENLTNAIQSIELLHTIVLHRQFVLQPVFFSEEFANILSQILINQQSSLSITKCLEIIATLCYLLNDDTTFLTGPQIVDSILQYCVPGMSNLSEIRPSAFFAIANICAISKFTRNILISRKAITFLKCYLQRETIPRFVYSGLRLSINLLYYGVDDIWESIKPLISKFRFHILSSDLKNRSLAAQCLILIIKNPAHIEECVRQVVHKKVFESIIKLQYCPRVFELAIQFIRSGIKNEYLSPEFVEFCGAFLDAHGNDGISLFLNLVKELNSSIYPMLLQSGSIDKIIQIALKGSFECMESATLFLIEYIYTVDKTTACDIALNGTLEACCNLIGTCIDSASQQLNLLNAIYQILHIDDCLVKLAKDLNLDETLDLCELENNACKEKAQLILKLLYESSDAV